MKKLWTLKRQTNSYIFKINKALEWESFPIPTLYSLLDSKSGSKYFSKNDLKNAYTQIDFREEARKLTNFITEEVVRRYTRTIYGALLEANFYKNLKN